MVLEEMVANAPRVHTLVAKSIRQYGAFAEDQAEAIDHRRA